MRPLSFITLLLLLSGCSVTGASERAGEPRALSTKKAFWIAPEELECLEGAAPYNAKAAVTVGRYYIFYRWNPERAQYFLELGARLDLPAAYHNLAHLLAWRDEPDLLLARYWLVKGLAAARAQQTRRWVRIMEEQLKELSDLETPPW